MVVGGQIDDEGGRDDSVLIGYMFERVQGELGHRRSVGKNNELNRRGQIGCSVHSWLNCPTWTSTFRRSFGTLDGPAPSLLADYVTVT